VAEGSVEEGDVARVDAALERLEPVALLDSLGDQGVRLRQERPLELLERRGRAGPPVGEDDAPPPPAPIDDAGHPRGEAPPGAVAGAVGGAGARPATSRP